MPTQSGRRKPAANGIVEHLAGVETFSGGQDAFRFEACTSLPSSDTKVDTASKDKHRHGRDASDIRTLYA
ncbi:hypothetical protein [Paenibacillus sediminis]|uniref:Integrase catalytic domain-containing protein n=1 Tax=Paenibacillus sediminis TaxID=664909 RepID=A0ABS4GZ92_9BACL|nr:hypothetical protein [Paenibacillus sediminis]MBP1935596.1 hypothetical protein [Paenibacillus sediminis]